MTPRKRKASSISDESTDEMLIIALDFGTTYSGVAYCFANKRDPKPAAILDWPGTRGMSVPKIPTLISYDEAKLSDFKWGASVEDPSTAIVGIKLLLDPSQKRPAYLSPENVQKDLSSLPRTAVEVAADFIGKVYQHALAEISKKVPRGYMELCSKEFVLTVPAVWSDAAKHATMQAAQTSGIHPVTLVKEPEAAALYTAQSLDFALQNGDAFVVCDAGGGTVDLISYEVEAIYPCLEAKELVPGTGGMSGSIGLNQRFAAAVQALVGQEQWQTLQGTTGWASAQRQFDKEIKKAFRGSANEEFLVPFPLSRLRDDPIRGLVSSTWRMTGKDVQLIFEPLIQDIINLIAEQVTQSVVKRNGKAVTGIMLVGGFGGSLYLRDRVEADFPTIQVLQPEDAWAAIVK
ncbi:Heat shock protein Hsp70 [Metarhizium brunneum]